MDRRSLKKLAGIAGVLATGIAPAVHAQAAVRWRLASSFPKSLDTIYGGAELIAKRVEQLTSGKFQIRVFAAGEIVPAFGVVDAIQQGLAAIEQRLQAVASQKPVPRPPTALLSVGPRARPSLSAPLPDGRDL